MAFVKVFIFLGVVSLISGHVTIVSRREWNARSPKSTQSLRKNPPPFVVIHHSDGGNCLTTSSCKTRVKNIQTYHMNNKHWQDIGYNFLVGGDGVVYEGRGWGKFGSHAINYNGKSIGICVIGNFDNNVPDSTQLQAVKDLIEYGVENSYIDSNYKLLGHRQNNPTPTDCPGSSLFSEIKTWPHFESNPS